MVLQHLKHATVLHEFNRRNIMNGNILDSLKPLVKTGNPEVNDPWTVQKYSIPK